MAPNKRTKNDKGVFTSFAENRDSIFLANLSNQ